MVSRSISVNGTGCSTARSNGRTCSKLADHLDAIASLVPSAEIRGPRCAPAWKAATIRASWITASPHVGAAAHQRGQPALLGHPAHHHQRLGSCAVHTGQLRDAKVDIGRQPPVQPHLALAGGQPAVHRAEVQETQVNGLLQLVRPITNEEHHPDVRLADGRERRSGCEHDRQP
jgi:hypothetical protein